MQLVSYADYEILRTWGWIEFWRMNRRAFVELARRQYRTLLFHTMEPWVRAEILASQLKHAVTGTRIFTQKCDAFYNQGVTSAKDALKLRFAEALARYIVDMDWPFIALLPPEAGETP